MRARFTILILFLLALTQFPAAAQSQCLPGDDFSALGAGFLQEGAYDRAVAAFTCAIEGDDQNPDLYYQRSEAYYALSEYDQALADLKRADKLAPDTALLQFALGKVYHAMNQYAAAIQYFDAAASVPDSEPDADYVRLNSYGFRGLTNVDSQKYEEAIEDFNRAIELDSTWILPVFYRAVAHANLRHYEAAVADFNRAFALSPNVGDVGFLLGDVAVLPSEYDGLVAGVNTLTVNLQLSPRDVELLLKRGTTHAQLGELEEAISDFSAAIELDSKNADAFYQRALARQTQEENDAAVADFTRAIEIDPENADYYLNRSNAYQALKDYENAVADSSRYIELQPDDENGYLNRGIQYSLNGEGDKAGVDFLEWTDRIQTLEEFGGALTSGEPEDINMEQGSVFRFEFDAQAGDHLSVSAVSTNPYLKLDTLIIVLGPDGTPLTAKDDNIPQQNIRDNDYDFSATIDDFEAPEDGTYTLVVTHAGGNNEGPVTVLVTPGVATTGTA